MCLVTMAQYCSDSDSDSGGSFDGGREEYSNIDYGVFSVVSFGPTSVYGTERGRGGRREEAEEDLYELVEV